LKVFRSVRLLLIIFCFPGERLTPNAPRALEIEHLIQGIEQGFMVDMGHIFQEGQPIFLLFCIVEIRIKNELFVSLKLFFKVSKNIDRQD
jgi:hypothetical protein